MGSNCFSAWRVRYRPETDDSEGSMPENAEFERIIPVIPVRDLQEALERYRKLGFAVRAYGHGTGYGYADRGRVSIHISEWNQHDPKKTGSVVYIYVSDADAVRAEWMASGVEGRFTEAADTEYGNREFGFVDADGTLHRVGSPIIKDGSAHASPPPA